MRQRAKTKNQSSSYHMGQDFQGKYHRPNVPVGIDTRSLSAGIIGMVKLVFLPLQAV